MVVLLSKEERTKAVLRMKYGYVYVPRSYFRCLNCNALLMLKENDTTEDTELYPAKRCNWCNSKDLKVEIK